LQKGLYQELGASFFVLESLNPTITMFPEELLEGFNPTFE